MFDNFVILSDGVAYFHPLFVLCLMLLSSWMPSLFRGLYRLISPVLNALGKLFRY